ncbi:hypothetical protein [Massilia sp. erpn]|uniref:hypothetical protein n=1 Tax=Massilia sp. erpn TaxID=2738142 RepID=UPI002105D18B|nr:hypothetical protein [Massilia sp. erpn]UTY58003.1 hypothetical protein HPQ68_12920 [Massilia sp. erpn]
MKKQKLVLLAVSMGLGIGLSQSAFALPDPDWCLELMSECRDGGEWACNLFRTYCHG